MERETQREPFQLGLDLWAHLESVSFRESGMEKTMAAFHFREGGKAHNFRNRSFRSLLDLESNSPPPFRSNVRDTENPF
ncbi:hypothetical protein CEXT_484151 [Caerostris extrusa]|uniref:Uncharacterized protein n=1 Tax=Caerostris extrusa TaxID=172846 RepID=A0AAV4NU37_CAEEX|nr:hypothetical protein CEXT_484151 [Caerostris extrusa]